MSEPPEYPFESVLELLSEVRCHLIPDALQEIAERRWPGGAGLASRCEKLLRRARGWRTEAQMRAWLHNAATLRSWAAIHHALRGLMHRVGTQEMQGPAAREAHRLVPEIVGCPTPLNLVRLALREASE